ncbi:hypothetical protein DPMN_173266 [Dreissena polymorpha]|uniref:Uncharacterized protein n=1 Tax=Dreissena polymorpha TaxID=45954 RepID=A0A9D4IGS7_DREPO|nr:hypothetical protein DPMN_173266 [Dreissena polymorpha]
MTEEMQSVWTISAPNIRVQKSDAGFYRSGLYDKSTTQILKARTKRDASDLEKLKTMITICSPYTSDATLRNIINGIVAGSDVNVHAFPEDRNTIIRDIIGKLAFADKFKRKDRVKILENRSACQIASDRSIDPSFLF